MNQTRSNMLLREMRVAGTVLLVAAGALLMPRAASAFCGFYVSGASEDLYNNATRVAMMREGQQTVMSMQNNYQGPPEDFAMVVPVPEVLEEDRVKTIEDGVFDKLDDLTAPRLVEYWQKDPCTRRRERIMAMESASPSTGNATSEGGSKDVRQKVDVEAQFDVGEYEVVVLSAEESNALDTWLRQNDYNIPDEAAQYFRPYIQRGSYFFVAKVDVDRVQFQDEQAVLSPIRFHYESDAFKLPVRLGLINSNGSQDLITYLLARNQRYRVANYPNATIPTNLPVDENEVKGSFAPFYDALFEKVLDDEPEAVVTEYSWNAGTCDPCPVQPLQPDHLQTLGADILVGESGGAGSGILGGSNSFPDPSDYRDWTVTRLHTRYSKETLGQDLVFEKAPPIRGGRGQPRGKEGEMPHQTARQSGRNNFQARYMIRHFWDGDVDCDNPNWSRWGGRGGPQPAGDLGFESNGGSVELSEAVEQTRVPELGVLQSSESEEDKSGDDDTPKESDTADGESDGDSTSSNEETDDSETSSDEKEGDDELRDSDDVDLDDAVEQDEIPGVDESKSEGE